MVINSIERAYTLISHLNLLLLFLIHLQHFLIIFVHFIVFSAILIKKISYNAFYRHGMDPAVFYEACYTVFRSVVFLKKAVVILLIFLLCIVSFTPNAAADTLDASAYKGNPINAQSFVLIDAASGDLLYSKSPDTKIYPASTTKIMTAMLAIESGKLDDIVTVPAAGAASAFSIGCSLMGLQTGEKISVIDLVRGILLASGDEAATTLAIAVSGSVDNFVTAMNNKAKDLGMTKTKFANPSGLHNDQHYSTASDMAKLARYAMQNQTFAEIVNTQTYTTPSTEPGSKAHVLTNTNYLILPKTGDPPVDNPYYYEYATGIKTGLTPQAKGCLVASAKKGSTSLIVALFNDGDANKGSKRWNYTKDLFEFAFTNLNTIDLSQILANYDLGSVQIENAAKTDSLNGKLNLQAVFDNASSAGVSSSIVQMATQNPQNIKVNITYTKPTLSAPIKKGDILGTATATINGNTLGTFSVAAARDVSTADSQATDSLPIVTAVQNTPAEAKPDKRSVLLWLLIPLAIIVLFIVIRVRNKKRRRLLSHKKRSYAPKNQGYTTNRAIPSKRKYKR